MQKNYLAYIFIIPSLIFIISFLYFPMLNVFKYSLYNYNTQKPFDIQFIGVDNFVKIFTGDTVFWNSLWISFQWVLSNVIIQAVLGLIVSSIFMQGFRGRGFLRTIAISPWAVSGVLTATMWSFIYNEHMGLLNDVLKNLGIISSNKPWIGSLSLSLPSTVIAEVWRGLPFFLIIFMSAMQTVPIELYEAATVDGAGRFKKFTNITMPFIKETIVFACILRAIWTFNSVDLIYVLTNGGPVNRTTTLAMYVVRMAEKSGEFGYGSALAVIAFLILLIFAIVVLKLTNYGRDQMR